MSSSRFLRLVVPTIGADTSAAQNARPHQHHERAARLHGHSPSLAKLHASATCAMLTPFLPASSSTLHTRINKDTGISEEQHVCGGATYRVTMSAVPAHVLYGPVKLQDGQMSTSDCGKRKRH